MREKGEGGDDQGVETKTHTFFEIPLPFPPGTRLVANVLHGAAADPNLRTCYLHVQVRERRGGNIVEWF